RPMSTGEVSGTREIVAGKEHVEARRESYTEVMVSAMSASSIGPVTKPRTEALYRAIIRREGTACHLCGDETDPMERSADHIRPKSRGGSNGIGNCALAH